MNKFMTMTSKEKAHEIVEETIELEARPKRGSRRRIVSIAYKKLIELCAYNNFNIDGDHGINVINVKDILSIIEELENE
jgi:hypothetical protein